MAVLLMGIGTLLGGAGAAQTTTDEIGVKQLQNQESQVSRSLEAQILERFPAISGWTCERDERRERNRQVSALPGLSLICDHSDQNLRVTLMIDEGAAKAVCGGIDHKKSSIANGTLPADRFGIFEKGDWKIQQGKIDISGCYRGIVALKAAGDRSSAAIAAGPSSIKDFAVAMQELDLSDVLETDTSAEYDDTLQRLLTALDAQSDVLASSVPFQDQQSAKSKGAMRSGTKTFVMFPKSLLLASLPAAHITLELEGCEVVVDLSAGPREIYEAQHTGRRWAKPGGEDGKVTHAYKRRNTARFVGSEAVDGTGISAFVDGRVLVRVSLLAKRPCDHDPDVVMRVFDRVLENDFGAIIPR
ncbi:MAG: hypothetical protein AB8B82_08840 [Roseovarius sp.]